MDGPRDYHTKRNKSERVIQIPYDITYKWNLKNDANKLICKTEIDSQTQTYGYKGKGSGRGLIWEFEMNR